MRCHSGDESFLPITSIDFIFNHVKARIWIVTETTKLHVSCRFRLRVFATAIDADSFCFYVVFGQIVNMQQHIYNGCLICSFHSDPSISLLYTLLTETLLPLRLLRSRLLELFLLGRGGDS